MRDIDNHANDVEAIQERIAVSPGSKNEAASEVDPA